jgi:hypothetical protein
MDEFARELFTLYGPLAVGWVVACFLGWVVFYERKKPEARLDVYEARQQKILDDYHDAIVAVTRAIEHLAVLIEERTRRQP